MSFTVVPLHNMSLPSDAHVLFGNDFVLQEIPEWVKKDRLLESLSRIDRQSALDARYALVAEYEASSIGEPDPAWKGKNPRAIQKSKSESAMLANMALWLVRPSPICFTVAFHAISWNVIYEIEKRPLIQQIETQPPLYCHPQDIHSSISVEQVEGAGKLYVVLRSIPRKNAVWTAVRALWAALTMYARDLRYSLFWIGLEALFGPDNNSGEITYKLAQRIAFFISESPESARETFRDARMCYGTRSQIVHGRWEDSSKTDELMGRTEAIVRRVFLRLLNDPNLLTMFLSKNRDAFLEDLIFSKSFAPPVDSR